MGGTCVSHWRAEKCIPNFDRNTWNRVINDTWFFWFTVVNYLAIWLIIEGLRYVICRVFALHLFNLKFLCLPLPRSSGLVLPLILLNAWRFPHPLFTITFTYFLSTVSLVSSFRLVTFRCFWIKECLVALWPYYALTTWQFCLFNIKG